MLKTLFNTLFLEENIIYIIDTSNALFLKVLFWIALDFGDPRGVSFNMSHWTWNAKWAQKDSCNIGGNGASATWNCDPTFSQIRLYVHTYMMMPRYKVLYKLIKGAAMRERPQVATMVTLHCSFYYLLSEQHFFFWHFVVLFLLPHQSEFLMVDSSIQQDYIQQE